MTGGSSCSLLSPTWGGVQNGWPVEGAWRTAGSVLMRPAKDDAGTGEDVAISPAGELASNTSAAKNSAALSGTEQPPDREAIPLEEPAAKGDIAPST
uniref:Uncharacterized protein n=1 Tax=Arundo donax TaxID=35708 RepID=A0A0A9AC91_ARUDO